MDPWGVLVWNMALMSLGSSKAERNMTYLSELLEEHAVKIALLNEASVPHLRAANAAVKDGDRPPFVFSEEGITGRDFWTDDQGARKPKVRKRWSAGHCCVG